MTRPAWKSITLKPGDHVANIMAAAKAGDSVTVKSKHGQETVILKDPIPIFHKFAVQNIPKNTIIVRGGIQIGIATRDISIGAHVHVSNLRSLRAS